MTEILGYGEDTFTFWMLKKHLSEVLGKLGDHSKPSDCLIFFRPSFGRSGGKGRSEFGEFDAILASSENIYLIESKWDGFGENKKDGIELKDEQVLRHKIFTWYYMNWNAQQYPDWEKFKDSLQNDFIKKFPTKKIAPSGSLLAENLKFVLEKLQEHSKRFAFESKELKNVVIFFYDKNKSTEKKSFLNFEVINIDYTQYKNDFKGNFIILD